MRIERTLPFLILATVALSGLLLGMGQGDYEPFIVAVSGATAAYVLVDWWKWFRLPNWIANLLAIIVTIITVSNFYFTNDSVRHLLGVGKLLVYLQTILMFQRKSARVYWQVLVLSLLQIVVGAVFNLGFEGGVLFIVYMMVAGVSMMVLHLYQDRQAIRSRNEEFREMSGDVRRFSTGQPLTYSTNLSLQRGVLRRMVGSFFMFAFGALIFSIVLFYFLPRDHTAWSGPKEAPMQATGFDDKVDMAHSELILLSSRLEMNVRYWYPGMKKPFRPNSQPYLRGMALSNIKIEGNKTKWVAPPYQVLPNDFRPLFTDRNDKLWVNQEIVLEPTEDPLLYSAMPARAAMDQELSGNFEWCWPLGGITRQRSAETITVAHFRYKLKIPILDNGDFYSAWRYIPRDGPVSLTLEEDPGNYKWLTYLDRSRYPTLVQQARQIADRVSDGNHQSIARQMESWFRTDRFSYTLDFRNLDRDNKIDTVEDFFANFRSGHCEYFASSLVLMLRSQGIPARLVVGFRGGDINDIGGHLDVEARHAHAWVEAYVRPGDCSDYLVRTGQASRIRGAWLRLDPTPAVDQDNSFTGTDDALDFAKSLWRDYVLGLQSETRSRILSPDGVQMSGLLRFLDLDWWQNVFQNIRNKLVRSNGWQRYLIPIGGIVLVLFCFLWYRKQKAAIAIDSASRPDSARQTGWVRRRIAKVLNVVSPRLGNWVYGNTGVSIEVPFYSQMVRALNQAGFERLPHQTQREFALVVASGFRHDEAPGQVGSLTGTITDFYYLVRFGTTPLDDQQTASVKSALHDLEDLLKQTGKP